MTLTLGFAVVPTLAALQQAESLAAFLAFIARYPSSALKVHPATMTLGKVQLPQTCVSFA